MKGLNLVKVEVKDEEEVHLVEEVGCGDRRNGKDPEGKKEWPEQRHSGMKESGIFVIPGERM